jgi:hypothetical protein
MNTAFNSMAAQVFSALSTFWTFKTVPCGPRMKRNDSSYFAFSDIYIGFLNEEINKPLDCFW